MKKIIPLILMSSLILCSCGKVLMEETTSSSSSSETTNSSVIDITETTQLVNESIIGAWKCEDILYEFREDSTGIYHINYSEDYIQFTYEIVDDVISITRENNPELTEFYTFELDGNSLILSDSFNTSYTYTRVDDISSDEYTEDEFNIPQNTQINEE